MIHEIKYNSQRNNPDFKGQFPGWKQCFSTSAWMFMSNYTDTINGTDDIGLSKYLDDVEVKIGTPGIGEKVFEESGFSSFWWTVQKAGIEKWLHGAKVEGKAVFCDCSMGFFDLKDILDKGPVILGTNKLAGLPGGHIILVVGYDDVNLICHDPYGDANSNYKNFNGANVKYPFSFIMPHVVYAQPDKVRCMYWNS